MRLTTMVCAGALALTAGACVTLQTSGPNAPWGLIYTDVKGPGSYYEIENMSVPGSKSGKAQAIGVLSLVAVGDNSVEAACKNGGIKKINTIDFHVMNVLGVYTQFETLVTGE